jgi:hypothetical protein
MDFANKGYGISNPSYCAIVKHISAYSLHQQLLYEWAITGLDSKKSTMLVRKCFRSVIFLTKNEKSPGSAGETAKV